MTLDITPDSLAFYDINMDFVVEPGDFEIMVGNSSRDCDLQKLTAAGRTLVDTPSEAHDG